MTHKKSLPDNLRRFDSPFVSDIDLTQPAFPLER